MIGWNDLPEADEFIRSAIDAAKKKWRVIEFHTAIEMMYPWLDYQWHKATGLHRKSPNSTGNKRRYNPDDVQKALMELAGFTKEPKKGGFLRTCKESWEEPSYYVTESASGTYQEKQISIADLNWEKMEPETLP